ncbi:hypothetical protein RJ640_009100, partial [Escallonia rubra]
CAVTVLDICGRRHPWGSRRTGRRWQRLGRLDRGCGRGTMGACTRQFASSIGVPRPEILSPRSQASLSTGFLNFTPKGCLSYWSLLILL